MIIFNARLTGKPYLKLILLAITSSILISCGNGSSSSSGGSSGGGATLPGTFEDSAVDGLSYTIGSVKKVTKDGGKFTYQAGDVLAFSVGSIQLGTATGASILTPLDLVAGSNTDTATVQNIASLLQTLDSDGDADNGITILPAVANALNNITLTFTAPTADFATEVNSNIITIINGDDSTFTYTVITAADAIAHLQSTLDTIYNVSSISIASADSVVVGQTINLAATVLPITATTQTVTWAIQNGETSIATITGSTLTGVGIGTTTILATSDDNTSITATQTITVTATPAPMLALMQGADQTVLINGDITNIIFSNAGGDIVSCAITGTALPRGLAFDTEDCTISGSPEATQTVTTHTVTATDAASQTGMATVRLTVNDITPMLTIVNGANQVVVAGGATITNITFRNAGGKIASCTTRSNLPRGLMIDNATCTISGAVHAAVTATAAAITVIATNATDQTGMATVNITINQRTPILTIGGGANQAVAVNTQANIIFSNSGGDIVNCTVSPALPPTADSGLVFTFNTRSCTISGSLNVPQDSSPYTVTAFNNTGQSHTAEVNLRVTDTPTPDIRLLGNLNRVAVFDEGISIGFTSTGTVITGCSVTPATLTTLLGLSISNTTCRISGTPIATQTATTYTVTATDGNQTDTAIVKLRVNEPTPRLTRVGLLDRIALANTTIDHIIFTNAGGTIAMCAITPELPGLKVDNDCSKISGIPEDTRTTMTYTVTGKNATDQTHTATVRITVIENTVTIAEQMFSAVENEAFLQTINSGGTNRNRSLAIISGNTSNVFTLGSRTYMLSASENTLVIATTNLIVRVTAPGAIAQTATITINVTAPPLPPGPATLTAVATGVANQVRISWAAVVGADSYTLYSANTDSSGAIPFSPLLLFENKDPSNVVGMTGASATTATATSLLVMLAGTQTVNYLVTATDGEIESLTNSTQTAATAFATPFGTTISSPDTGRVWMDRNLGAVQLATGSTDTMAYGDLYQWGRANSGYQRINRTGTNRCLNATNVSELCTELITGDRPTDITGATAGVNFITFSGTGDWLADDVDNDGADRSAFWARIDGSSICPTGFNVPTQAELIADTVHDNTYTGDNDINSITTAFNSFLKLPAAGLRSNSTGSLALVAVRSYLWSRSADTSFVQIISSFSASGGSGVRSNGYSVRCIKAN